MADYNITFPDGTPLLIQQGTINNIYDLPLTGQDAINYGDDFATAYIRLLSSFANTSPPSFGTTRKEGQLWFDTTPGTGGLNVFDGVAWDSLAFDANVVHTTGTESISGTKTFSDAPDFIAAGSPFTVNSPTLVVNLNASLLNGNADTAFATAFQGTLADAAEPGLPSVPTDGFVLSSTIAGARSWISLATSTGNVDPQDSSGFGTPATTSVLIADDPTGDQQPGTDSGLTYNATTNALTTTTFIGNLTGNASTATLATTATSATTAQQINVADTESTSTFVVIVNSATGDQIPLTDEELTYNANTGTLDATFFSGSGASLTNLDMQSAGITGVLQRAQGGTQVTTATGNEGAFVYAEEPTFVNFITTPVIRNGATGTTLEFNSGLAFRIVSETATDQCSGAEVVDGSGVPRPVGFNVIPNTIQSGATLSNLNQARVGYSLRGTNSTGTKTYLVGADTTIPNGATWLVKSLTSGAGVVIVTSDSGVTLRWLDGSGSPQEDVSGASPFSLARGGIATVQKISDTEFEMWGVGIS